ncbi:hypothetical protein H0H92_012096, partial [Tricholoma furcatifolium]
MVENLPDSTYEMVGDIDKQIEEIKDVVELPVKHPEHLRCPQYLLYGPPGTGLGRTSRRPNQLEVHQGDSSSWPSSWTKSILLLAERRREFRGAEMMQELLNQLDGFEGTKNLKISSTPDSFAPDASTAKSSSPLQAWRRAYPFFASTHRKYPSVQKSK